MEFDLVIEYKHTDKFYCASKLQGRWGPIKGFREYSDDISVSLKAGNFFDQMCKYQFSRKNV
jgi:hypothetical protein